MIKKKRIFTTLESIVKIGTMYYVIFINLKAWLIFKNTICSESLTI